MRRARRPQQGVACCTRVWRELDNHDCLMPRARAPAADAPRCTGRRAHDPDTRAQRRPRRRHRARGHERTVA